MLTKFTSAFGFSLSGYAFTSQARTKLACQVQPVEITYKKPSKSLELRFVDIADLADMAFRVLLGLLPLFALAQAGLIDRGQDAVDAARYPLVQGFIRIELHIIRLDTQGKSHTGLSCDITDKCDPKVIAFIDTERPNHDFGGDSVPYSNYIELFNGNNVDVPEIRKTISRDICGKGVRKVALRVRAIDKDTFNDDKIDNYKCFITGDHTPAADETSAQWSEIIACPGEDRKGSKAYMQWRWYYIPEVQCRPSSNGRTFFSGMFSR